MAGKEDEDFADFVCSTLHSIGYTWEIIQHRREIVKQLEHSTNSGLLPNFGLLYICAGSKREGSNTFLGGDTDGMCVFKEVIATEDVRMLANEDNLTVLKLDSDGTAPGYTRLSVKKHGGGICRTICGPVIAETVLQQLIDYCSQVSDNGQVHLSSELLLRVVSQMAKFAPVMLQNYSQETLFATLFAHKPRAGPSAPFSVEFYGFQSSCDLVYAISCDCPGVLESFLNRPRSNGWPTEDIIRELSHLEAHVVPVGSKRSSNHCLEWRICFTKAEIHLIECLSEPQFYVFVLLKIFAKDVLKNVWDGMTSYMMKNVILWVVELTPGHRFRKNTVVDRFLACLFFLKMCVNTGRLPSYMISERNLLSHDQLVVMRPKLLSVLDDCLREKGSCLMRSKTLRNAMIRMYTSPESAMESGRYKERFERSVTSVCTSISLSPMTSLQDMWRIFPSSSQAPGIVKIVLEMLTEEDFVGIFRDPASTIRSVISRAMSYLR